MPAQPSVVPTSIDWVTTAGGGIDFDYQVSGGTLMAPVTVAFFWASGTDYSEDVLDDGPDYTYTIPKGTEPQDQPYGPIYLPGSDLTGAPEGANYLLVVTDPDDTLGNFDPDANVEPLQIKFKVSHVYQNQGYWAASSALSEYDLGRSTKDTIGSSGCALTSLVMALNYNGVSTDPFLLNQLLTANPGGYTGNDTLNWGPATAIAAAAAGNPLIQWNPEDGFDPQQLRDLLTSTSSPVVVAVRNTQHANGVVTLHFVLVTGIDGDTFYINDPAYPNDTTLNAYANDFELRGYVSDPTNLSDLFFASTSDGTAASVTVTDPQGNVTSVSSGGQPENQIPNAICFEDGPVENLSGDDSDATTTDFVYITQPTSGAYTVQGGAGTGTSQVESVGVSSSGLIQSQQETAGDGGTLPEYSLSYDSSSPGEPVLSISDVSAPKGHSGVTGFEFAVSLSTQPPEPVTVDYATADGTASESSDDYQPASGTLTFTPGGPLTQTAQVLVNGNTNDEPDETFDVNLSDAINATVVKPLGVGTIQDDSTPISINDVSELASSNGTTSFAFTVSLAHASTLPVSVDYATADGTAALANGAFQAQSGTLKFQPGQTTQTVTIIVNADSEPHQDETFFVNLANPINGALAAGGQQGVGTILGDSSGTSYYVNGPSTVGDVFCTAPGNNSNNGLSPATPVASLTGLLSMYTFHPGDTIYIDTGAYDLYKNVTLGPQFSGVRIVGAGPRQVTPSLDGSAVLADGPVAFWRLGDFGGPTAVDASGNGYNGTYVGEVTPDPNAPSNDGAAYFNGDGSEVTVPYAPALNPSQFTIEAWVNFQGGPATAGQSILNLGQYNYYLAYWNGSIDFQDGGGYALNAPLPAGVWTFVAATFDSSGNAMLYVNGVLVDGPDAGVPFAPTGRCTRNRRQRRAKPAHLDWGHRRGRAIQHGPDSGPDSGPI